jgi:hypothetical protein
VGIQTIVVFIGLAIALSGAVIAGSSAQGAPLAGWLAIGLLTIIWALLAVVERVMGRKVWHYTAPYPYRRMEVAGAHLRHML